MHVVLASGSPRRRDLLSREGVSFRVLSKDVDESLEAELAARPHDAAQKLASRKAQAVANQIMQEMKRDRDAGIDVGKVAVIGSDTMVVLDGKIFGKPRDLDDAASMLRSLSGNTHEVITGVAVWMLWVDDDDVCASESTFEETSYVTFKNLTKQDIDTYLACGESFDKAGAYAVQGEGARLVQGFDGDHDTIVGLPVKKLLNLFPQLKD